MDKANANGETVNELVRAQAHVWNHIFSFINSMSLKCAVDLGIPDIIHNHGNPMTVSELVAALPTLNPTKARNVYRLMRILVHSGFFAQQKLSHGVQEDGYVLTDASRLLLKDNPLSVTPFLKVMLNPIITKPWDILGPWLQNNDSTPFDTAHGKPLWDYACHVPKLGHLFNEGMASDARLVGSVLIDKCKGSFEGLDSLVDVGGGTGTLAKAIADAFPHLECTVFDLPHVVAGLQDSGNLKYVGGDMFEDVPVADAVLLKWILHDWNDDECVKILKRCKEAISEQDKGVVKKKKVMIVDMVVMEKKKVNDESFNLMETQLFFDMLMMVLQTGSFEEMRNVITGREINNGGKKDGARVKEHVEVKFKDPNLVEIKSNNKKERANKIVTELLVQWSKLGMKNATRGNYSVLKSQLRDFDPWGQASDSKLSDLFNHGMARYAQLVTSIFIDKYQGAFEVLNSSVDVGGRTGALGKAIADAFLHLECSLAFDLSRVVVC
ncbi:hypothetical protein GQ457_14G022010 [Hibiscus cannabinus]